VSLLESEINRRRTFAIISHPDAGKTTITEKLLLYGGAIQMAGVVKAKKSKKFATSDWMEIEKKRGISVTSSVMKFPYQNIEFNLIDTPGHQDFSEDTYRTLTAVDSVLMLIDAANGVEAQTKKLFEVCSLRKTPVTAFINKMDREGRPPFELLDEIEKVLGIACCPMTWPIGMGDRFRGVYDRVSNQLHLFNKDQDRSRQVALQKLDLSDKLIDDEIGSEAADELRSEIELLGAGEEFSVERYLKGELAPVYFGSALNNFGVQTLLDAIVRISPKPQPRLAKSRLVEPLEEKFSSFIFKIQANMDPNHRDRVAFMRICSGKFERGMKAFHVRGEREIRLARPTQFMANDRSLIDEAYAGDIVGIHDPGIFKIGDTLSEGEKLSYTGVPVFAPEHFVRVDLKDPLKSKQLHKALDHLSEEGAVQVFRPTFSNDQILGVVGALQFEVVKFRIENEYNVKIALAPLPFKAARWVSSADDLAMKEFLKSQNQNICMDQHDNPTILLSDEWRLKFLYEKFPKLVFHSTSEEIGSR
jgi:peptide chain release factor 3